jgi:hypothetical protein
VVSASTVGSSGDEVGSAEEYSLEATSAADRVLTAGAGRSGDSSTAAVTSTYSSPATPDVDGCRTLRELRITAFAPRSSRTWCSACGILFATNFLIFIFHPYHANG